MTNNRQTRNTNDKNDSQKKHHLGRKLLNGFNMLDGTNLTGDLPGKLDIKRRSFNILYLSGGQKAPVYLATAVR